MRSNVTCGSDLGVADRRCRGHMDDAESDRQGLAGAQDAIQSLTLGEVWYSGSTDLTGQGRAQIVDRNWVVCTSTPPPGASFNVETKINFDVVKIETEKCP